MKQLVCLKFHFLEDLLAFRAMLQPRVVSHDLLCHEITCHLDDMELTQAFYYNLIRVDVLYKKGDNVFGLMLSDYFLHEIYHGNYLLSA